MAATAGLTLHEIVKDELRGPVEALVRQVVRELVREQLNGYASPPTDATHRENGAMKVCALCGETKPVSAFNAGRRQCRKCRNARYPRSRRVRGTPSETEPPRTDGSAEAEDARDAAATASRPGSTSDSASSVAP